MTGSSTEPASSLTEKSVSPLFCTCCTARSRTRNSLGYCLLYLYSSSLLDSPFGHLLNMLPIAGSSMEQNTHSQKILLQSSLWRLSRNTNVTTLLSTSATVWPRISTRLSWSPHYNGIFWVSSELNLQPAWFADWSRDSCSMTLFMTSFTLEAIKKPGDGFKPCVTDTCVTTTDIRLENLVWPLDSGTMSLILRDWLYLKYFY